jgi:DNA invertase Pin-like site-specific DNA recombinase
MPKTKVVLLGRVSTDDRIDPVTGERKGQDPSHQISALRDLATRKGWQVVAEVPRRVSAWNEETAEAVWKDCLEAIERNRANLLAVWSWDRVSRRGIADAFVKIGLLEGHYACAFYSLQEPPLCTGSDPATRELMLSLMAWNARWESEHRSQRLKAAYANKRTWARNGGGRARWGRGLVASLEDYEEIRHLRVEGLSVRAIAAKIGLSKSNVADILKNPDAVA